MSSNFNFNFSGIRIKGQEVETLLMTIIKEGSKKLKRLHILYVCMYITNILTLL